MNLSFLPFCLRDHISSLQLHLTYQETTNEVSTYMLDQRYCPSILGIQLERVTLYCFGQQLISAYLLVSKQNTITHLIKQMQQIEQEIGFPPKETETGNLLTFSWADDAVSFSINLDGEGNEVYLYITLKDHLA